MDTIFSKTREVLSTSVVPNSSVHFPMERLDDPRFEDRCCFTAHLPGPQSTCLTRQNLLKPGIHDCLRDVSVLIKATDSTLWLLKSYNHDTAHACLGFEAPDDASILQSKFYASQQGSSLKRSSRIAILARRHGGNDEIWLIDDAGMMQAYGLRSSEPRNKFAFYSQGAVAWSNCIYESAPLRHLKPCDFTIISLTRGRSKSLFVSGCRGIACVLAAPSFLTLYDLEDIDEDDREDL